MKKTIRQLAKEATKEIRAERWAIQEKWLFDTFGSTVAEFEAEGIQVVLGQAPHNAGLKIKQRGSGWSRVIMDWESLHSFFEYWSCPSEEMRFSAMQQKRVLRELKTLVDAIGIDQFRWALDFIEQQGRRDEP